MSPRALARAAVPAIVLAFALIAPERSIAQYMYLDADGDGIRTAADVVAPSGPTLVTIWLRTDANRDGTPAVCSTGEDLTLYSYEVSLHAGNGAVSWGSITNAVAGFTTDLGSVAVGADAHVAFGSGNLSPGLYRLATVQVSVTSGSPSIQIVSSSPLSPGFGTTFSSQCSGMDFDNTLKLGADWFDVDGLPFGGVANESPVLGSVAPMTVAEGSVAEQVIHATDPEGSPVTFAKASGPSYMSVTTIAADPPDPTGRIRLEPDYSAAGTAEGVVSASDGFIAATAAVAITVANTQRPPVLGPVSDIFAAAGGPQVRQSIYATDPDQEAALIQFQIPSGPGWVTALTHTALTPFRVDGEIVVTPSFAIPTGDYPVVLLASKGSVSDSTFFTVHFSNSGGNQAPSITGMPDVVGVTVGTTYQQEFFAIDPDGDPLILSKAAGPDYMTVTKESQTADLVTGLLTLTPGPSDAGGAIGIIQASDGSLQSQAQFSILAVDSKPEATRLDIRGEPGDYISQGQSYTYTPPVTEFTARTDTTSGVVLFLSAPPAGNFWSVRFSAPEGQQLAPGFYPDAIRSPFNAALPGLSIDGQGRGCNTLTGLFEIKQLDIGPDGELRSIWARFEQHCESAVPGLTGEVRVNAHADLAVTAPLSRKTNVGSVLTFPVYVDSAGSAITLRVASGLPEGADFIDYGNGFGTFTWRPVSPLEPTQIVFEARDAEGHVDRSTTLLAAGERELTSLSLFSDPGEAVGGGVDQMFGASEIQSIQHFFDPYLALFFVQSADHLSSYYLYFRAADAERLTPGVYEGTAPYGYTTPGTPTMEISHGFSPCGSALTGRFEVREATYDSLGHLSSFDAYFSEHCGDEHIALTGEIRFNAHPAIEVSVPLSRAVREGESTVVMATAPPETPVTYAIQGLPLGATFSDLGDNSARIAWTPDFAQSGVYQMRLVATKTDGASVSIPLRLNVLDASRPPVADAGGPYDGIAGQPVAFDGSGSSDPDGTPLYFFWSFGDNSSGGEGVRPFHTYSAAGEYSVVLFVTDEQFQSFDGDSTTASIHENLPARLFVARGNREIRLGSGKPAWCAQMEAIRSGFNASDVLLSSLVLVSDSTSGPVSRIHVISGKPSTIADTDGNGIEEVTACFAKQDLQQLFAYVSGRSVERVVVEGLLANGNVVRAVMQIEVVGASGKTSLAATPNPLNPETVISYWLPRGSRITLRIFDVAGRLVTTLADRAAPPGYGSVAWKPDRIASGVYYASLETETDRRTLRLVVLK